MTRLSRALLAIGSILLIGVLWTPIWRIHLVAPQYPEGLGMEIRANQVRGQSEHDLDNINNLNHYIGMKRIESNDIAELRIIPWVIGGLALFGVVAAAVGRRRLAWIWVAAFGAFGVVGLVDFWRWEYDYGHNLDMEHAIIKVPGMVYQPPIIGAKQLLNFTAASWPAIGAILAAVAFALGVAAVIVAQRARHLRYAESAA
jgi:copper chaperone NosL